VYTYSICREWYHGWRRMTADFGVSMIHYLLQPRAWSWTSCFPTCKFFPFWVTVSSKYCCYYGAKSFICLLLSLFDLLTQHSNHKALSCDVSFKACTSSIILSLCKWVCVSLVLICVVYGFIFQIMHSKCMHNDTQNVQYMYAFIVYLYIQITDHFLIQFQRVTDNRTEKYLNPVFTH